jgi:hypothetical protein
MAQTPPNQGECFSNDQVGGDQLLKVLIDLPIKFDCLPVMLVGTVSQGIPGTGIYQKGKVIYKYILHNKVIFNYMNMIDQRRNCFLQIEFRDGVVTISGSLVGNGTRPDMGGTHSKGRSVKILPRHPKAFHRRIRLKYPLNFKTEILR